MGRQIPVYATVDDVNQMAQCIRESFPDLTRYDYHRGYIGLFDGDMVRQRYYLAHRIEFSEPMEPLRRSVEVCYNSYTEISDPADRSRFGWHEGRIYLNTWAPPMPEQIDLYNAMTKYIRKTAWRFKWRSIVFYILPDAMSVICRIKQDADDLKNHPLFQMLEHATLISPRKMDH